MLNLMNKCREWARAKKNLLEIKRWEKGRVVHMKKYNTRINSVLLTHDHKSTFAHSCVVI